MQNFEFFSPTRVYFGRGEYLRIGEIVKGYGFKKLLLHYGGGSVKKTGLFDRVAAALTEAGVEFVELGGARPNPGLTLVLEGIEIARREGVELVLAVGGGSALDSAKLIAVGAKNECDPWLFLTKQAVPAAALPVASILTLAATGSEMSASAVITNEALGLKRGYNSDFNRPLFSILDPELTFTLPPYQTACGVVDIMMHTLERYMSREGGAEISDKIAEAVLKTTVEAGAAAMENPRDYEARANLMWAGSVSHNDLTGLGRDFFMIVHQLEHELSGMYQDVAHGAGLAVLWPAWARYSYAQNLPRFCRYAVNVWGADADFENPEKTALAGIKATESFFKSIGMPSRLREFNVSPDSIKEMAVKCTNFGARTLKGFMEYGEKEIEEIFRLCL